MYLGRLLAARNSLGSINSSRSVAAHGAQAALSRYCGLAQFE